MSTVRTRVERLERVTCGAAELLPTLPAVERARSLRALYGALGGPEPCPESWPDVLGDMLEEVTGEHGTNES